MAVALPDWEGRAGKLKGKEVWSRRLEKPKRLRVRWCSRQVFGSKRMGGLVCAKNLCETLIQDGYVELEINRNWNFGVVRAVVQWNG